MKTQISNEGDTVMISMMGRVDYETQDLLKEELRKIIDQTKKLDAQKKVIFDLKDLQFVGSSGISLLVQTLREFNSQAQITSRYCHVSSEFKRVIESLDEARVFSIYDTTEKAQKSFDQ